MKVRACVEGLRRRAVTASDLDHVTPSVSVFRPRHITPFAAAWEIAPCGIRSWLLTERGTFKVPASLASTDLRRPASSPASAHIN